jgi:integrase
MKLQAALDLFLSEYRNAGTREAYGGVLQPMVNAIGPARPLNLIQPADLVSHSHDLNEKGWSLATVRKHIKTIKTFFNWCIKLKLITESPADAIRTRRLPTYISRDKAMQDDELAQILAYARFKPRDYALILFFADTGCRAGGAAGLRVEDIDFQNLTAHVTEKGDKTRPVAFGEECSRALRQWITKRKCLTGYVFSKDGKKLTADTISQIVRRSCLHVGVRSLGSHSLRHRKGHQLADAKVAPSIAATALGHSDPVITLQHYFPADWASAENELRKLSTQIESPKIIPFRGQKIGSK